MFHAVFTIVTPLRRESLKALDAVLDVIAHDPRTNEYLPFGEFPAVHFASFVIFERETEEPLLVFESSVDGGAKPYFESLLKTAGHGLDAVYGNVDCYPIDRDSAAKLSFFVDRLVTPSLFHVGTPFLAVRNIEADRDLRDALETDLDVLTASPIDRPRAKWLWRRLADLVGVPPSLSTAWMSDVDEGQGPPNVRWIPGREPGRGERLRAWGLAATVVIALLASLSVVFGALLLWGVNALIGGYIVLSVLIAVANAILCGWPAGGLRFSWPAVRLMLAAAGIALSAGVLLKIPVINEWISSWPPTAVSIKAFLVVLVLLGAGLIGPGLTLWLSTNILPVPSREGEFRPLSRKERAEILDAEDRDVQNHMSSLVRIEPVWYRLLTLRVFLWLLHRLYYRVVLTKGKLISIPTVHFAQWVLLDRGRFPFLAQAPHSAWYSAYPGLTVRQVWTNQKLRTDLFTDASDEEAANRLGRLAAADPL